SFGVSRNLARARSATAHRLSKSIRSSRIPSRDYRRRLHHQDDCALGCARAMDDALGYDIAMPRLQINGLPFEIDDEVPIQDKEKLVVFVVLMPVVLALHHSQADNGVVHFAQGLVVPLVFYL